MSQQNLYTLSLDSIKYVLGLISATVDLPNTILDDLNIQTTTTYSSYRLDTLLKALKEENIKYCDEAIAGLNKLSKEIVDDSSKVVKENTIYLILTDAVNNVYEQWLLINGTPQMIGTTEMNLDSVYTKDEADARYTLITDFNSLKTEVDKKVNKTSIITAKNNLATDDQVYSAKAINTELDGLIKKVDISTIINNTSTNDTVPTNKAVYDSLLANEKLIQYNYDFASSDSLNINLPRAGFYKIDNPTKGVPEGNPKDYVLFNIPWRGDSTLMKFGWQLLFTPRVNYFWIRRIWDYKSDYVYTEGDYSVFKPWQKVCSTSVEDTSGTATVSNSASGTVNYIVKNGICYVSIKEIAKNLNGKNVCNVTGLPKAPMFIDAGLELDGTRVGTIYTFDGDTFKIHKISASGGYGSFSYPVAES